MTGRTGGRAKSSADNGNLGHLQLQGRRGPSPKGLAALLANKAAPEK